MLPLLPPSHPPFPPLSIHLFSPSSANSKYLSGGLPGVYAVLDVSNPGVFLQRVDGFQDVLSPVFHLWKQPNTTITHWALFKGPHQGTELGKSNVNSARAWASSFSDLFSCSNNIWNWGSCVHVVVKWLQFLPWEQKCCPCPASPTAWWSSPPRWLTEGCSLWALRTEVNMQTDTE